MSDELAVLGKETDKVRKATKELGTRLERGLQEQETLVDKVRSLVLISSPPLQLLPSCVDVDAWPVLRRLEAASTLQQKNSNASSSSSKARPSPPPPSPTPPPPPPPPTPRKAAPSAKQ